MIGAVNNRTESVAFSARFSRKTIKAVNLGLYNLSHGKTDVSKQEMTQLRNQFHLIKKDLAATGESGTYMLKHDRGGAFIQYETTGRCKRDYLPWEIQKEMIISNDVVQFPPKQLYRLAKFLKEFKTLSY